MGMRQPAWNIYEAVILLDGYLEVVEGKKTTQEIVKRVSLDLRRMAVHQGIMIDETYRDENGIYFQLCSMESAYHGFRIKIQASRLFSDTVKLYKNNRPEYEIKLREARAMIAGLPSAEQEKPDSEKVIESSSAIEKCETSYADVSAAKDNQFVRSDQDARLLHQYPIIYKKVFEALKEYSKDQSRGASIGSIYDLIEHVGRCADIENILDNASWSKGEGSVYYFSSQIEHHDAPAVDNVPLYTQTETNVEQVEDVTEQDNCESEVKVVDFDHIENLDFTAPVRIEYFGDKKDCKSWDELYVSLFEYLYEDYSYLFLPGISWFSEGKRIDLGAAEDREYMSVPKLVPGTDLYLETDMSAADIVNQIKKLLIYCSVDFENVVIKYRIKDTTENPQNIPTSNESDENEKYEAVLKEKFSKGFRLSSSLEIRRFRKCYAAVHEQELDDSDELIEQKIRQMSIVYENRAYLPQTMVSPEVREKLFAFIEDNFNSGKKNIYYQALFSQFETDFLDCHIYDAKMLRTYLDSVNDGRYYIQKKSITQDPTDKADPIDEVREFLIQCGGPVAYEEMYEALPNLPKDKIRQILGTNAEFINNARGSYFHVQNVK